MPQVKTLILVLILVAVSSVCNHAKQATGAYSANQSAATAYIIPTTSKVDFNTQVKPILESRCTPCHFAGGTMYERLPFDRPETIKKLGTKLFTRIKDEKEQRLIRQFLSE
ncbi:MAG: hypothetical protein ICV60_16295 [Pyrinomonadaceae bacterium]|nr:hypothetical protein [Pyrinomonadaceae bacterium]